MAHNFKLIFDENQIMFRLHLLDISHFVFFLTGWNVFFVVCFSCRRLLFCIDTNKLEFIIETLHKCALSTLLPLHQMLSWSIFDSGSFLM